MHVSCIAHQLFISGCFSVRNKELSFDSVFLFQILAFTLKIVLSNDIASYSRNLPSSNMSSLDTYDKMW